MDLVLLDTIAAQLDGYELCRRIQYKFGVETVHIPATDELCHQAQSFELEAKAWPTTSPKAVELLAQVEAVLQRRRQAQAAFDRRAASTAAELSPAQLQSWRADDHLAERANVVEQHPIADDHILPPFWSHLAQRVSKIQPSMVACFYLVAVAIAEVLTATITPRFGLALHGLWLTLLLMHSALEWERPVHRLLLSLTLVPLIRVLSLSLPLVNLPIIYWYLIIAIPLLTATFMITRTLQLGWSEMGLNLQWLPIQVLIAPLGFAFGYLGYQILMPAPLISHFTWPQILGSALILFVSTGFTEELIFRGVLQRAAIRTMGNSGIIYIAALYTNLHLGHRSPTYVLFVFGLALFFGWVTHKTRSLLGVTLCHGLTNIVLFLILPFFL